MRIRTVLIAGLAAALAGPAAIPIEGSAARRAPSPSAKKVRLKAFTSCAGVVRYARRHASRVDSRGRGMPRFMPAPAPQEGGSPGEGAPPPAAPVAGAPPDDSSTTNVQEAGVDEPDIVKSDGDRIFAVSEGTLHAVDARASRPRLLGSLRLDDGWGHELLLHEDRALVLSQAQPRQEGGEDGGEARTASSPPVWWRTEAVLTEVDVSDPSAMRVVRTLRVDGRYVSARASGASARVVLSSPPRALEPPPPSSARPQSGGGAAPQGRTAGLRRKLAGWLPSYALENRASGRTTRRALAGCRAVRRPLRFSGLDMLTVLTIDLSKGLPAVDSDAVFTEGETVYASSGSLYVATPRWVDPEMVDRPLPPGTSTAIHKFDISRPDSTAYRASGHVPGFLLNQFSLSEHRGFLRAASTSEPDWWAGEEQGDSESFVTVLRERAGKLVEAGRVDGLGRGERIYAVRFIDDVGYVVTFRQTDPLYTIDLAEPDDPKLGGELKILGYSAYLHPVGDDLLLGVGQDATEQGRTLGTQLSLFDVSDLRRPLRIHQRTIESESSSEVEYDHHAFLYWAPRKLAVMPLEVYGRRRSDYFSGAVGFRIARAGGIDEVGRISHPAGRYPVSVRRSLVVGGRLFTLSDAGLMASDLETLGGGAWVAFPAPPSNGQEDPPPPGPPR